MQSFSARHAETGSVAGMAAILRLIRGEMDLVEREFARQADSNIQVVGYLGEYLRASGGKRVRPSLLVLANKAAGGDGDSESVIRLATVMEMIHTATLVHDDIIDNASTRRNTVTVTIPLMMKVTVARMERIEPRPIPQTPCPLVHPPPMRVPKPTRNPDTARIGQAVSVRSSNLSPPAPK